ncbi:MAG: hypothetical protein V1754_12755 [Pseudomonadota bacterium]
MKKITLFAMALFFVVGTATPSQAQYAVGHRIFGGGTSIGIGYSKMDFQFPNVTFGEFDYLLPTLELKFFLADTLSIDLMVPVANIAASNALRDYFMFSSEAYLNFHPSAPSTFELFVAPGFGFSYASWDNNQVAEANAYAFHIPVRLGFEINNSRRNFSFFVAARPFFSLIHTGNSETKPGGGGLLEIGVMAYATKYRANRY